MRFANPYWPNKLKISTLQRWIIVHSILYSEMSSSIIPDKVFDENAYQLVKLQKEYKEEAEESEYWYVFYDFDGSTGFDLFDRLNKHDKDYLTKIANHVLKIHKSGGHKDGKKGA